MKILMLLSLLTTSAFANLHHAPKNFEVNGKKAVFIDITNIDSKITYDLNTKTATAISTIEFRMNKDGHAIFDLRPEITHIDVNGTKSNASLISAPADRTEYRMLGTVLTAGTHKMTITNNVTTNVKLKSNSVRSAFWMSDLADRKYIEQYLPTNIEFDQYAMNLEVKINGNANIKNHELFSNGFMTKKTENHFMISFPEYFTASSFYFHLTEVDAYKKNEFRFESINGKSIPVIIYASSSWSLKSAKKKTIKCLNELEGKLGAWSHPSLTIYIAGSGGMEHSGATMTSMYALEHEITHSYFARGVMPVDGNSGWLDEAIASWRDDGYKSTRAPNFSSTSMAAHSEYRRSTDRKAYTQGANFMAFLNNRLENQGGLISFLAQIYTKYSHKNITTRMFQKELEAYAGESFANEFNKYIFGAAMAEKSNATVNPYHVKQTREELLNLL
jgi:hypothetical protein